VTAGDPLFRLFPEKRSLPITSCIMLSPSAGAHDGAGTRNSRSASSSTSPRKRFRRRSMIRPPRARLDQIHRLLRAVAGRQLDTGRFAMIRKIASHLPHADWENFVSLAVTEIRPVRPGQHPDAAACAHAGTPIESVPPQRAVRSVRNWSFSAVAVSAISVTRGPHSRLLRRYRWAWAEPDRSSVTLANEAEHFLGELI